MVPKANALALLKKIKTEAGIATFTVVDNVEAYTAAALAPYDIIVFNYIFNTQYAVGKPFETAFKAWLASGNRGWMGYHSSGANDVGEWPWYRDSVTVMRYHVHSVAAQPGRMYITTDAAIKALTRPAGHGCLLHRHRRMVRFRSASPRAGPGPVGGLQGDLLPGRILPGHHAHPDHESASHVLDPGGWQEEPLLLFSLRPFGPGIVLGFLPQLASARPGVPRRLRHGSIRLVRRGSSIRSQLDQGHVTGSRELRVDAAGPHKLEILSAQGKVLESLEGPGPRTYRPAAFAKAGVYCVRYQGNGVRYTQRILVY